jgi:hypothetical protein
MRMKRRIALIVGAVLAALLRMGFILTANGGITFVVQNYMKEICRMPAGPFVSASTHQIELVAYGLPQNPLTIP